MNFTEEYYPDLAELTAAEIATARAMVVSTLQEKFKDVDLSPGTVTGDIVVSPMAEGLAAIDVAYSRLMSDLNLENVAGGLIYSCNFVEKYLGNFSVYDTDNLRSFGLVRLTFSDNSTRTLDKAMTFKFNTPDIWRFKVSSESEGIHILPAGSSNVGGVDTYVLSQTSATTWAVDLPLEGVLSDAVTRGTTGSGTLLPASLIGIASAIDFLMGAPAAGLPDLANMARRVFHSLTANSRGGTRSLVLRHWPEMAMVSPIITGDLEMQRQSSSGSAVVLQAPAMDLYTRSVRDNQIESQIVKLYYTTKSNSDPTYCFRGQCGLLHRPSKILSVEWAGATGTAGVDSYKMFSRSTRGDMYGSLYCGSRYESLWLQVSPTMDTYAMPSGIQLSDADGTGPYAYFRVKYIADPLMEAVASTMESPDNAPPGLDVVVKSGPLIDISGLTINYARTPGTTMLLQTATSKIVSYFSKVGHPASFQQTALHDIMRNAGASSISSIGIAGHIRLSAAEFRLNANVTNPLLLKEWDSTVSGSEPITIPCVPVASVADLSPQRIVVGVNGGMPEMWSATTRNVRFYLDSLNITFHEI